ncbi:alpha/beta hydrolase [Streptomyces hirsutus]
MSPAVPCATVTGRRPAWLGETDLDVYAAEFERTGMSGALARYRTMDRDWEDLAGHTGAPLTQPSLFIGGALDASTAWMGDAIKAFPGTLPGLWGSRILDGCGHWVRRERPEETNAILTDWLAALPAVREQGAPRRTGAGDRASIQHAKFLFEGSRSQDAQDGDTR